MININNAVQFQHLIWDRIMKSASVVVDATCGNGHDLLYLAERAQSECHLYGIDIQEQAVSASRELLASKKLQSNVTITFLHNSHDIALHQEIKENTIDLIIFNLGYLPGGDHSIITRPHNTIEALNNAFPKLAKDGIITIVAYPGTPEGMEEKEALPALYSQIGERFHALDSWSMYLITSYEDTEKYIGRKADKNRKIYNGMLKTYYYQFLGPKPPKGNHQERKE